MTRRPRGAGSIFKMKGSNALWIKYHRNGRAVRESTHTASRNKADQILRKRLGQISTGTYIGPSLERIHMSDLAEDLIRDYKVNGRKSLGHLEARWTLHLKHFFGRLRAVEVTSDLVTRYVDSRQEEGASNATINRELSVLKRTFYLARECTPPKVAAVPHIAMLEERNVRKGFVKDEQYDKLAAECAVEGLWLRTFLAVAYSYGWRKSELLNLRVRQVDLFARTIRLEVGETKNSKGRTVSMTDEIYTLLAACIQGKKPEDHVFTRENGVAVKDFRKVWCNVCERAGVAGLLVHDLRRTGARNLRREGVAEGTIMKIGGWKTRSVFQRYDIQDESDLEDAAQRLNQKREKKLAQAAEFGQSFGQSATKNTDLVTPLPLPAPLPN